MIFSLAPFALTSLAAVGFTGTTIQEQTSLVAALPADTLAALHLPNPKALMAQRETSQWVAFAVDESWEQSLGQLLVAIGDDITPEEVTAWRAQVLGSMADATAAVAFFSGAISADSPPGVQGLIVRGGAESSKLLRRFIGSDARAETLENGHEVLLSAAGRAELYYEHEGLIMVLSTPTVDGSKAIATECLKGLAAGTPMGPFAQPGVAEHRTPSAAMEFAVNTSLVWDAARAKLPADEATVTQFKGLDALSSIDWIYGTQTFGAGESMDMHVYLPYGEDNWVGEALSFFGDANKSLLNSVPASAVSATVASFDVKGFSDRLLEVIAGESEEVHGQALAALEAAKAAVGINILEDVIGNMTGEFLGFSSAFQVDEAGGGMSFDMADPMNLVAMMHETEPTLELIEAAVALFGVGSMMTTETVEFPGDDGEIELYKTAAGESVSIGLGIGHGRLLVSTDTKGLDGYISLMGTDGKGESLMQNKALQAALERASGAVITLQPTGALADSIEGMSDLLESQIGVDEFEVDDEDDEAELAELEAMGHSMDVIASLWRQYFEGTSTTAMHIQNGLIHIHSQSR